MIEYSEKNIKERNKTIYPVIIIFNCVRKCEHRYSTYAVKASWLTISFMFHLKILKRQNMNRSCAHSRNNSRHENIGALSTGPARQKGCNFWQIESTMLWETQFSTSASIRSVQRSSALKHLERRETNFEYSAHLFGNYPKTPAR